MHGQGESRDSFRRRGYVAVPAIEPDELPLWRQRFEDVEGASPGDPARERELAFVDRRTFLSEEASSVVGDVLGPDFTYESCVPSRRLAGRDWLSDALEAPPSVAAVVFLDELLRASGVKAIVGSHRAAGSGRRPGPWSRVPATGLHRKLAAAGSEAIPGEAIGVPAGHVLLAHSRLVMSVPEGGVPVRTFSLTFVSRSASSTAR